MSKEFDDKIKECLLKEKRTPEEEGLITIEYAKCMKSFLHFLKWVKIVEPPILGQTGGRIIPFALLPHILTFIKALLTEPLISVLKARQIYISTTLAAYHLWRALSGTGANLLLFSKGQPEAKELLAKSYRQLDLLPDFLKFKAVPDSTEEMGFPVMHSSIKAFPSTATAGISYTASSITADEHAAHPYADENFTSAKPTIDAGRQFISVFTVDPYSNDNLATNLFVDAMDGKNDFLPIFFPYDVVPGRDDEWYERTKRNIPERDLAKLSPDLYMAKNYPRSIEEALSTASSVAVFDKKVLNIMAQDVRGKINEGGELEANIYKDYHVGNKYVAASDVGWGVGGDFSTLGIMDEHGDIVADIMSNDLTPDEFAYHSVELLKHYKSPWWWIENNPAGGGRQVIKKAVALGYRKLGHKGDVIWSQLDRTEELNKVGFNTNEKSRADLFGALIPAVNDMQLRIYNEKGLRHFYNMIRNSNKNGKIEAMSSTHDDYVIMVGICVLKKRDMKQEMLKPLKTLTWDEEHPSVIQRLIDRQLQGVGNE